MCAECVTSLYIIEDIQKYNQTKRLCIHTIAFDQIWQHCVSQHIRNIRPCAPFIASNATCLPHIGHFSLLTSSCSSSAILALTTFVCIQPVPMSAWVELGNDKCSGKGSNCLSQKVFPFFENLVDVSITIRSQ